MEVGIDFFDGQAGGLPVELKVVSAIGTELDHDFCFDVFVVGDCEVEAGTVASVAVGLVL